MERRREVQTEIGQQVMLIKGRGQPVGVSWLKQLFILGVRSRGVIRRTRYYYGEFSLDD